MPERRTSLRNASINYRYGWFFVTFNTAHNKTVFGAIAEDKCILNALGKRIEDTLAGFSSFHPEMLLDTYVIMPNHVHYLIKIEDKPTNDKAHLGKLVRSFKTFTTKIYHEMVAAGEASDIGEHLWQLDFWDKIVSNFDQLEGYRKYIRENPSKWTRDRFGAITSYAVGNIELLNEPFFGFVASEGISTTPIRKLWEKDGASRGKSPVISTFTSPEERSILSKALASRRPIIKVFPGGIPPDEALSKDIRIALEENRALLLSPVASGTGLNKQRANWCNEYILKNAAELWAGHIRPGGSLESLIKAFQPR